MKNSPIHIGNLEDNQSMIVHLPTLDASEIYSWLSKKKDSLKKEGKPLRITVIADNHLGVDTRKLSLFRRGVVMSGFEIASVIGEYSNEWCNALKIKSVDAITQGRKPKISLIQDGVELRSSFLESLNAHDEHNENKPSDDEETLENSTNELIDDTFGESVDTSFDVTSSNIFDVDKGAQKTFVEDDENDEVDNHLAQIDSEKPIIDVSCNDCKNAVLNNSLPLISEDKIDNNSESSGDYLQKVISDNFEVSQEKDEFQGERSLIGSDLIYSELIDNAGEINSKVDEKDSLKNEMGVNQKINISQDNVNINTSYSFPSSLPQKITIQFNGIDSNLAEKLSDFKHSDSDSDVEQKVNEDIHPIVDDRPLVQLAEESAKFSDIQLSRIKEEYSLKKNENAKRITGIVRTGAVINHNGDVIIEGAVHSGAEIHATGDIHVYGVAGGRLFAGCDGDNNACIYIHEFDSEFISIGGHGCNFESVPDRWKRKPCRISLKNRNGKIVLVFNELTSNVPNFKKPSI